MNCSGRCSFLARTRASVARAVGLLGLLGLLGCGGAGNSSNAGSPPAVPVSPAAPPSNSESLLIASADAAKATDPSPTAPDEVEDPHRHDPADLAMITITRITVSDSGDSYDQLHERADRNAVARCYAKLPAGHRTDVPIAATLERKNPDYQGEGGFAFGTGRYQQPFYPPRVEEPTFTACVTRELSQSATISLSATRGAARSVRVEALAYPYGSVDRYLTGSVGHGRP